MRRSFRGFREEYLASELLDQDDWASFVGRQSRYEILWSTYENTVYKNIHDWAKTYKTAFALYQYIRSIYSPAYRLGEFWKSHLWGGQLDPDAEAAGALPIVTDNEAVRPHIAQIWRWSNWGVKKDILTLWGAALGDAFLRVVDDPAAERVYLELVHPGTVSQVVKDAYGHIKGYEILEERADPRKASMRVTYKETVAREDQDVVFKTFLNDTPYAWNGVVAEWSVPYGFVPMVHIQHNDVGLNWGWSEFHPGRSKMHELDDLGALLSDQVRKSIFGSGWAVTGTKKPSSVLVASKYSTRKATEDLPELGFPEVGREEVNIMYFPSAAAKAQAMVLPLNIAGVVEHIEGILKDLERDYPELRFDALRASGDVSGKALRIARQPAETKVNQRRANYDEALVQAQMMALSIGGMRGLFPFSLDSFSQGALDHSIGPRDVFYIDLVDQYEEELALWKAAKEATEAGLPLRAFLARNGWAKEDLNALEGEREVGTSV